MSTVMVLVFMLWFGVIAFGVGYIVGSRVTAARESKARLREIEAWFWK